MENASLEINSKGKLKFYGSPNDFYFLLILGIVTYNDDIKEIIPKDKRLKKIELFIKFCLELKKDLENR